jgi:hypothetical protein
MMDFSAAYGGGSIYFSTTPTSILSKTAPGGHFFIILEFSGNLGRLQKFPFPEGTEDAVREEIPDFQPEAIGL